MSLKEASHRGIYLKMPYSVSSTLFLWFFKKDVTNTGKHCSVIWHLSQANFNWKGQISVPNYKRRHFWGKGGWEKARPSQEPEKRMETLFCREACSEIIATFGWTQYCKEWYQVASRGVIVLTAALKLSMSCANMFPEGWGDSFWAECYCR